MPIFGAEGMGVDLGSMNTTIFLNSEGEVVLREPTRVLLNAENMTDVLCVGAEARAMSGRAGDKAALVSPVQQGAVGDVEMAALVMVALAEKATERKKPMDKATLVTNLTGGASKVERAALFQAMNATGAKKVAAVRTPVAAAIGADVDISRSKGRLIVTLGGGVSEIAVLSMSGIAALRTLRYGGQDMDEAIVRWFWREHGLVIGMRTAEQIKREIGTVSEENIDPAEDPVLLRGKNAATGKPMSLQITPSDVKKALDEPICRLVDAVKSALYNVPAEMAADIRDEGILISGGGALLNGLDKRLEKETGLDVRMSAHPEDDAAIGLGAAAADDRLLSGLIRAGAAESTGE